MKSIRQRAYLPEPDPKQGPFRVSGKPITMVNTDVFRRRDAIRTGDSLPTMTQGDAIRLVRRVLARQNVELRRLAVRIRRLSK